MLLGTLFHVCLSAGDGEHVAPTGTARCHEKVTPHPHPDRGDLALALAACSGPSNGKSDQSGQSGPKATLNLFMYSEAGGVFGPPGPRLRS